MKKWIKYLVVIMIGLSSFNYYFVKQKIPNRVVKIISEKLECNGFETFGGTLPIEYFWSNDYSVTVYLNSPQQKFVEVPIRIVDPSSPLMRILGLNKYRISLSKDVITSTILKHCGQ